MPLAARAALAAAAALAAGVAARAAWFEPRLGVVRHRTLDLPRWPQALDGLAVALIGDLHAGAPQVGTERVRSLVEATNAARPDLVLIAGDLVDEEVTGGRRPDPDAVAAALGGLQAPLGRFAVLGNHDRHFGAREVAAALERQGIDVLTGDARALDWRGTRFWLAGTDGRDGEPRDARPVVDGVPEDEPVLLLVHEPDVFPTVPDRVACTFAGHTHGGQVSVPGLDGLWTPSRFGDRYSRGHVVEGGRHLLVTAGVGTSRWPLRLGARPEVPVAVLRAAAGA